MPPRSKLTVSASAWRETPTRTASSVRCYTATTMGHIMRFCNNGSTWAMTLEERMGPHSSDATARAAVERQCCVNRGGRGGAVDSGGDPLFGLIPRVVGGAPDVDRVLPEQ